MPARLLLLGALALTLAAPAAAGAGRATVSRCTGSHLGISVRTQGVSTAAWIGVTVRNTGATCSLGGAMAFTIQKAGRAAAVQGSPLRIRMRARLGRGHTRIVKAGWSNWCGSRRRPTVVVRYAGAKRRTAFSVVPACIDRSRPSRLAPID